MTRASGKSLSVSHRRVKNQRLAAVGYLWAFAALSASPGARTHHDRRKTTGDRHTAAQRNLFNRLLGCLHHCLQTYMGTIPSSRRVTVRTFARRGWGDNGAQQGERQSTTTATVKPSDVRLE